MAYFANGTEGLLFQEEVCSKCVHFKRGGCAVWDVHLLYAYEAEGDAREILDMLITDEPNGRHKCKMFFPRNKSKRPEKTLVLFREKKGKSRRQRNVTKHKDMG